MMPIKLFLDDLRRPPDDHVLCRTAEEALSLLETGLVVFISFDHDLGTEKTGYDVAKQIEEWVVEGKIALPSWKVHSANPVGAANITAAMRSAERHALHTD